MDRLRKSALVLSFVCLGCEAQSMGASRVTAPAVLASCDARGLEGVAHQALVERDEPGAVVVVDLVTGEELVAVSNQGGLDARVPPGSTVKAIVALAGLDAGVITAAEQLSCGGSWQGNKQRLVCHDDHGTLDLATALATSCNAYFYEVADRLGTPRIATLFEEYGLGGLAKALREAPQDKRLATSTGHGLGEVTARELAGAFRMLLRTRGPAADAVRAGMLKAVASPLGTARTSAVAGMNVAGKTGTASVAGATRNHAWFVGYAPAESPRVLVLAYVEGKGTGGSLAAPIAGRVLKSWSEHCR